MLERLNSENIKNLAIKTANYTYDTAQMCAYGLMAGSVAAVLNPSKSNLPIWAIDTLSKTNNTAITYLSQNLNASYIVAPVVSCALLPLVSHIVKPTFTERLDQRKNESDDLLTLIAVVSYAILGSTVCSRLGYNMNSIEFFSKGLAMPLLTGYATQKLLDAALPLPKPEVSETVTV
jgi:hypothetical protein